MRRGALCLGVLALAACAAYDGLAALERRAKGAA